MKNYSTEFRCLALFSLRGVVMTSKINLSDIKLPHYDYIIWFHILILCDEINILAHYSSSEEKEFFILE